MSFDLVIIDDGDLRGGREMESENSRRTERRSTKSLRSFASVALGRGFGNQMQTHLSSHDGASAPDARLGSKSACRGISKKN